MAKKPSKKQKKQKRKSGGKDPIAQAERKAQDLTDRLEKVRRKAAARIEKANEAIRKAEKRAAKAHAAAEDARPRDTAVPAGSPLPDGHDATSAALTPPLPSADSEDTPSAAWTTARLRAAAKERAMPGYSSKTKEELLAELTR
jgi:hypothetical protein